MSISPPMPGESPRNDILKYPVGNGVETIAVEVLPEIETQLSSLISQWRGRATTLRAPNNLEDNVAADCFDQCANQLEEATRCHEKPV